MKTLFSCRRTAALLGTLFMLSGLLGACASSRLLKNPKPSTVADVGWTATAPEGLTVEVHQLIFRNSGGTWVRNANWDEFVLTITNGSADAIEIQEIDLYSDRLPAPEASSNSREQLDARSNRTLRAMKDAGIVAGVGIVGPSALIIAGVGTSGGMLSASSAGAAAAVVGTIAIPVGLIGGTSYVISRHRQDKKDKVLLDHRLTERGYGVPLQIDAQSQMTKSAFFPITPSPSRLVVIYSIGGEARQVALELPDLAGLHLKTPAVKTRPPITARVVAGKDS